MVKGADVLGHRLAESAEIMAKLGTGVLVVPPEAVAPDRGETGSLPGPPTTMPTARNHRRRVAWLRPTWTTTPTGPRRTPASGSRATGTRSSCTTVRPAAPQVDAGLRVPRPHVDRLTAPGGQEKITEFYIGLQPWGTPEQVFEKTRTFCDLVGGDSYIGVFRYGGMPPGEAEEKSMRLLPKRSCRS